jgi:L-ascorbate metabolism protein UlaG (beta-lactamase superfamily)
MVITWHGYNCFKIEETAHGRTVTVVTDPYAPEGKAKLPRNLSADLVTVSHDHSRHNNIEAVGGTPFVISGTGEYEVKDVLVTGVRTFHDAKEGKVKGDNTMYYITVGDVHMAHLGDLKHVLEEKHMGELHEIDVLFVPVGGDDVLDAKMAAEVVSQFEPRVIVPMHFKDGVYGEKSAGVEPFLKAMGVKDPERTNKLKLTAKDLPQEDTKIVVFEAQ